MSIDILTPAGARRTAGDSTLGGSRNYGPPTGDRRDSSKGAMYRVEAVDVGYIQPDPDAKCDCGAGEGLRPVWFPQLTAGYGVPRIGVLVLCPDCLREALATDPGISLLPLAVFRYDKEGRRKNA